MPKQIKKEQIKKSELIYRKWSVAGLAAAAVFMGCMAWFGVGGRKSTKNASSTQLFAYSKLCVEEKKNAKDQSMFFLNSSESEKLFYNIRLDPKKTALASYFSELLMYIRTEESGCDEIMRLTLNTLYFLDKGYKGSAFMRRVFFAL